MQKHLFIEDLFVEFARHCLYDDFSVDDRDFSTIDSFYSTLMDDREITKLQSDLIIRILQKYKPLLESKNISYKDLLDHPRWKRPFRVLDLSKTVFVDKTPQDNPAIFLRFPYAFKSTFEKDFVYPLHSKAIHRWNPDKKANVVNLYDTNLILLHDFLKKHNFVIDDSFLEVVSQIEEIWQNQEQVSPYCSIEDGIVKLKNAPEDAENFWERTKNGSIEHDLLVAKLMGYPLTSVAAPTTTVEKIASSRSRIFWSKNFNDFFDIFKNISGTAVVMLDRSEGIIEWLSNFVSAADDTLTPRSLIKVCFRDDKNEETKINNWIKENRVGGKIDEGRIFVFRHKPAKWLFNNKISVNMLVTNSLFPMTNITTQKWMDCHPFILHLGSIRASQLKENKIVEL